MHSQHRPATSLKFSVAHRQTHLLDLSPPYSVISRQYTRDRALNLSRAKKIGWQCCDADDPEPLIQLFQRYHAGSIPNGVAPWAYSLLRKLIAELQQRGLATLRYARLNGQIQAGVLFVREGNRLIYLFNAATEIGRRGNARTLLLDQMIRANAGQAGLLLDFESPDQPTVVQFYESFGARAETFYEIRYNRLTWVERQLQTLLRHIR